MWVLHVGMNHTSKLHSIVLIYVLRQDQKRSSRGIFKKYLSKKMTHCIAQTPPENISRPYDQLKTHNWLAENFKNPRHLNEL